MSEETSSQKQQQQQQQHVTSWPGKQVETLRLWEEAVKARKKGKMRHPVLTAWPVFSSGMPSNKVKLPQLREFTFMETL